MLRHPHLRRTAPRPTTGAVPLLLAVLAAVCLVAPGAHASRAPDTGPSPAWHAPVDGAVVHGFDPPARPWLPGHRGVDLAAPPGTPVVAPTSGTVTFAGQVGGKPVLVVSHGELRSTFEPVRAHREVGDRVGRGDVVGEVTDETTVLHCSPATCLHWGVRRGEAYLDPLALLGLAPPVVLLPSPAH